MDYGLVFCHGRVHKAIPSDFLTSGIEWLYVDIDESSDPDIIADVTDPRLLELLVPQSYSAVILYSCSILFYETFTDMLSNAYALLAEGGKVYIQPGIKIIIRLFNLLYLTLREYRPYQIVVVPGSAIEQWSNVIDKRWPHIDKNMLDKIIKGNYNSRDTEVVAMVHQAVKDVAINNGFQQYGLVPGHPFMVAFTK